jgi:uncharacterized protein (TIGR03083 family)
VDEPTIDVLIAALDEIFTETEELVRSLSESDAARPTDCPGWTVQDQLSHMVGLEVAMWRGVEPEIAIPDLAHVTNDMGRYMETHVEARRGRPFRAVIEELSEMREPRIEDLRQLAASGDDPMMAGPMGTEQPLSARLPVRVFDLWIHEQDIRRALGRPPRDQPVATDLFLDRLWRAWPSLLPKKAAASQARDLTVRFEVEDRPTRERLDVVIGDGGEELRLAGPATAIVRVGSGRGSLEARLADLTIEGDRFRAAEVVLLGPVTP